MVDNGIGREVIGVLDTSKLHMERVELRKYQVNIAYNCTLTSTLVVLPTGLGKTLIAMYAISHVLSTRGGRILFLAPTRPLVLQHYDNLREMFVDDVTIEALTGHIRGKKRQEIISGNSDILVSTPQVVERLLRAGEFDLRPFSMVVFDEAHHGTGNYAYTYIAAMYMALPSPSHLTMGITASPAHEFSNIVEVCDNLGFRNVEIRNEWDQDVMPYVQKREMKRINVEPTREMLEMHRKLEAVMGSLAQRLRNMGFPLSRVGKLTKKEILNVNNKISAQISSTKGRKPHYLYQAKALISAMLTLSVALEYARNQGIRPLYNYLQDILDRADERKSYKILAKDARIKQVLKRAEELMGAGVSHHPKLLRLKQLLEAERRRLGEDMKLMVFTNYRESCDMVFSAVQDLDFIRAARFFGQASKGGKKGMSQREQKEVIEEFENGKYNLLVATQVGEEGIDLPETDTVIFYEPVASAIRSIQRRGRTARKKEGRVYIFVTRGAEDEAFYWSAINKERSMRSAIRRIIREVERANITLGVPKRTEVVLRDGKVYILPPDKPTLGDMLKMGHASKSKAQTPSPVYDPMPSATTSLDKPTPSQPPSQGRMEAPANLNPPNHQSHVNATNIPKAKEPVRPWTTPGSKGSSSNTHGQMTLFDFASRPEKTSDGDKKNDIETYTLFADHRERNSQALRHLRAISDVIVVMKNLDVGDFHISDRVVIERKSMEDFVASIKDSRIFDQLRRLKDSYESPILIVEGPGGEGRHGSNGLDGGVGGKGESITFDGYNGGTHINSIYGTVAFGLIETGVSVVFTSGPKETAMLIAATARYEGRKRHEMPLRPHRKTRTLEEKQIYLLEGLPAVSSVLARRMLEHFGTVRAIANADIKALCEVEGIGKKKAEAIRRVFEERYIPKEQHERKGDVRAEGKEAS